MKLVVTKAELLALVSAKLGVEFEDITIVKGGKSLVEKTINAVERLVPAVRLTESACPPPDQKIPVIKALREVIPGLGLAEAKAITENWPMWIGHVKMWGRYPKIESVYPFTIRTK